MKTDCENGQDTTAVNVFCYANVERDFDWLILNSLNKWAKADMARLAIYVDCNIRINNNLTVYQLPPSKNGLGIPCF